MVQSYRDLKVWQKAMDLADQSFALTAQFPEAQRYVLVSQIQRSAISVSSNIAEGRSRHSEKDFVYHLNIARGSIAELETQMMLSAKPGYISEAELHTLLELSEEITKMLHGLKGSLAQNNIKLAKT